jgi:hypothetical protein
MYLLGGPDTVVTLADTVISGNRAATYGGGLFMLGGGLLRITLDTRIESNRAGRDGGGIYAIGSTLRREGAALSVQGNIADGDGGGLHFAGFATYLESPGSSGTFQPLTVAGNFAAGRGGGLFLGGESTQFSADGAEILSNSALSGGGAYLAGQAVLNLSGANANALCGLNRAAEGGSCVFATGSSELRLDRTEILLNGSAGGGPVATLEANGSAFVAGEGLLMHRNGPAFQIWEDASAVLRYLTIADNSGTSFSLGGTAQVSLLASIVDDPGQTLMAASIGTSFTPECVIASDATGLTNRPDNLQAPGDFVDRANRNYRLRLDPLNAAIDRCAGPATATVDLDGRRRGEDLPRLDNIFGPWDAGAFEAYDDRLFRNGFESALGLQQR